MPHNTNKKMSLISVTVVSKDGDIKEAGTVVLNSNRIGVFKTFDTTGTIADYFEAVHTRKAKISKYVLSDTVATVSGAIATNSKLVYALSVYDDNNSANSASTMYFSTEEIAKMVEYGSDDSLTWVWVEKTPGKVVKYLVNKPLETIIDYVNSGTTTTTTTSTTSTSTTSTSTTSTE